MTRFIVPQTRQQKEMIERCVSAGIPMAEKFEYPNGTKTSAGYMALTYSKRGNYHYLNGKRVARNFVLDAGDQGLVGE